MSKYTKIQACVTDQSIQLRNVPLIASGGRNEVRVDFTFCSLWESTAKTAVFYRDPKQAYHVLLVENSAVVPAEVLASDGLLYFGVFGTSEEQVRTTEVISLKVAKGAITYQGTTPEEPAPDIYTQLMSAYGKTEAAIAAERVRTDEMVAVERARIDELVAMRSSDGLTQIELSAENVSGNIKTNGFYARLSLYISNVSIEPGSSYYTDYFIPEKLLPFTPTQLLDTYREDVTATFSVILQDGMARLSVNNQSGETLNSVSIFSEYALATPYIGELADIRVSADGKTYDTAGEAVRKQMGAVGLTTTGKTLLRTLLYAAVYDSEVLPYPAAIIEQFLAELNAVTPDSGGGTDAPDDPVKETYTVTYNLDGVVSTNTATSATEGNSFTTVLSAESAIDTVTVIMGGVDITDTAYNSTSGIITIAEVTGNIEITAAIADQTLLYQLKDASFNGQTIVDTGVALFDESKDFTILFDVKNLDCKTNGSAYLGLVEDTTVTDSYAYFCGRTTIANKNADTETIAFNAAVKKSMLVTAPAQASDANSRTYSAKMAITFDSASNKWNAAIVNTATGETVEGTYTGAVATIANTIAIGGTNYRGKTPFTCNEFSIYNRVLSADEISAWMQ